MLNHLLDPQLPSRSNIRDSVNYDPIFAQALNISKGYLPGNDVRGDYFGAEKFQGIENLRRPVSLLPQIPGDFDSEAANRNYSEADMVRPMFFSRGERIAQQDFPGIVGQAMNMSLVKKGLDIFSKLFGGNLISPQQIKRSDIQ